MGPLIILMNALRITDTNAAAALYWTYFDPLALGVRIPEMIHRIQKT